MTPRSQTQPATAPATTTATVRRATNGGTVRTNPIERSPAAAAAAAGSPRRTPAGTCEVCGQKVHKGKARPGNERVEIVIVTPALAAEWLPLNVHNRKLRDSRVTTFKGALERGEWMLTNDAVCFDEDGHLINGQHRIKSVLDSGISARLLVLWGLDRTTQEVMDGGLTRKLSDMLKLRGYPNYFALAAALNALHKYEYTQRTGNVSYSDPGERPTPQQAFAILERAPSLPGTFKQTEGVRKMLKPRTGLSMALYYIFSQIDSEDAELFFEQLQTGQKRAGHGAAVGLMANDPVMQLRNFLINEKGSFKGRVPDFREAAYFIKAWNMWRQGRTLGALTWHYGGRNKETFPTAQ